MATDRELLKNLMDAAGELWRLERSRDAGDYGKGFCVGLPALPFEEARRLALVRVRTALEDAGIIHLETELERATDPEYRARLIKALQDAGRPIVQVLTARERFDFHLANIARRHQHPPEAGGGCDLGAARAELAGPKPDVVVPRYDPADAKLASLAALGAMLGKPVVIVPEEPGPDVEGK